MNKADGSQGHPGDPPIKCTCPKCGGPALQAAPPAFDPSVKWVNCRECGLFRNGKLVKVRPAEGVVE